MGSEWQTFKLAEVYDFCSGLSKPRSEFGSGFPFLSFKDVFYNSAVPKQLTELVQSTEQERLRCSVEQGDVFLTRTSETLDELAMSSVALEDVPDATFNGFTKRLRPKGKHIVPGFARYFFRSPKFRAEVNSMSTMSTRSSLNNEMLERLTITFPEFLEQRAIAHILGTLDDKIECNRRMNETLEAMAHALFKAWFVDFEPVRAKLDGRWQRGQSLPGLPAHLYDLFPDRFVDSELGPIPEGWEVKTIGDFVTIKRGGSPRPIQDFIRPDGFPWVKIADATSATSRFLFQTKEFIKEEGLKKTVLLRKGALILSNSATPGLPMFLELDACIHDGWLYFPEKHTFSDLYLYQLFLAIRKELVAQGNGSVFTNLKTDILRMQKIVVASNELLNSFEPLAQSLSNKLLVLNTESCILAQLRDTLLPKLISGKLRIKDAERILEGPIE